MIALTAEAFARWRLQGGAAAGETSGRALARRAWRGYALCLLSMAAVDLFLWSLFVVLAGRPAAILLRLPEVGALLVVVNLIGGWRLFSPVARFLRSGEGAETAVARLAVLARLTGLWCVAVAVLFAACAFFLTPLTVYGLPADPPTLALLAARAAAWTLLLPYVAYFLASEHLRRLRLAIFRTHGLMTPPGDESLSRKLAIILLGGAVCPAMSVGLTLPLVPPVSPITGQPRELIIFVGLAGAMIALATAFAAMRASLRSGFAALEDGLRRVAEGDRSVTLAPVTDDELGRLMAGFNRQVAALAESEAAAGALERRRADAASQFHAAQKHAAIGRLAAGVAHDFNNILAVIMGYADILARKAALESGQAGKLAEIQAAAERGKMLVGRILAFSRSQTSEKRPMDLTGVTREAVRWLGDTLPGGARLTAALPDEPMIVDGDATGAHQVLANLCINAAHAMQDREGSIRVLLGRVEVDGGRALGMLDHLRPGETPMLIEDDEPSRLRCLIGVLKPGPHAMLTVSDDGGGIAQEVFRHVFEPYFTTKPVGEGSGLGLAAVMGIVCDHGGAIDLISRPGLGVTFRIFLPLSETGASADGQRTAA
ncbi:MAG: sensor histidine kinase [Rubrimonas sp.]